MEFDRKIGELGIDSSESKLYSVSKNSIKYSWENRKEGTLMLVAIAKPNRKKKDSSPFLQRMQPVKVMDSLLTRVLSKFTSFLWKSSLALGLRELPGGLPWLQTLRCNSLLIPNKLIFAGELLDSLLVLGQQSLFLQVLTIGRWEIQLMASKFPFLFLKIGKITMAISKTSTEDWEFKWEMMDYEMIMQIQTLCAYGHSVFHMEILEIHHLLRPKSQTVQPARFWNNN